MSSSGSTDIGIQEVSLCNSFDWSVGWQHQQTLNRSASSYVLPATHPQKFPRPNVKDAHQQYACICTCDTHGWSNGATVGGRKAFAAAALVSTHTLRRCERNIQTKNIYLSQRSNTTNYHPTVFNYRSPLIFELSH
eukprot:2098685-Amphidinium_carterae.1